VYGCAKSSREDDDSKNARSTEALEQVCESVYDGVRRKFCQVKDTGPIRSRRGLASGEAPPL
jgi:hypothetical protein